MLNAVLVFFPWECQLQCPIFPIYNSGYLARTPRRLYEVVASAFVEAYPNMVDPTETRTCKQRILVNISYFQCLSMLAAQLFTTPRKLDVRTLEQWTCLELYKYKCQDQWLWWLWVPMLKTMVVIVNFSEMFQGVYHGRDWFFKV